MNPDVSSDGAMTSIVSNEPPGRQDYWYMLQEPIESDNVVILNTWMVYNTPSELITR